MRRLWQTNVSLKDKVSWRTDYGVEKRQPDGLSYISPNPDEREPLVDIVADLYQELGYRFVPLVREDWKIRCELDVLFLRMDPPGSIYEAGDIDNRIKTLLDALRRPLNHNELQGNETPKEDEDPFFTLLEDDKVVTDLRVRTGTLLEVEDEKALDQSYSRLLISVSIKPVQVTTFNLSFA